MTKDKITELVSKGAIGVKNDNLDEYYESIMDGIREAGWDEGAADIIHFMQEAGIVEITEESAPDIDDSVTHVVRLTEDGAAVYAFMFATILTPGDAMQSLGLVG